MIANIALDFNRIGSKSAAAQGELIMKFATVPLRELRR